jgi:branched-chain amino acid transport system substrate-binding protein
MNALGGVHYNGKLMKVSVKFYDDQSNPSTAVQLVRQAVSSDHVDMLITGFLTPDTDAISSVVQQLQVPIVANAAEDPEFHVGNPYLYSIYPPSTPEMQMFANFFESLTPQPFNVSTVYSNEEAMVSMLSTTIYLLGSNYHVLYNATYDPTALTSSAADTYLLAAEAANPQMIMFTDEYPGNIITMIQQMASLNIRPNLIFSEDMWDSPFFISQLGATANGMVGQDNWAYNMTKADASGDYANASYWYNQTNAEFGASIATNQLPYQAIMACEVQFAAIEKAGATSGSSVIAALASLNMPTVDGRFSPNTYGMDPARDPFIIQIQNGEPVIVAPAQYATATVEYPLSPTWP